MDKINQCCGVMDAQGYFIDGEFYPKEIAISSHKIRTSILCDINQEKIVMFAKDRQTVKIVERMIRMPIDSEDDVWTKYENNPEGFQKYYGLPTILSLYQWIQTPERPFIAIKNSQMIPLLRDFDIPFIHIDEIKELIQPDYINWCSPTCTYHHDRSTKIKCAQSKADAIWKLINKHKLNKM